MAGIAVGLMAGLSAAGFAISATTTVLSFAEKAKADKEARRAEAKATTQMAAAREKLKVNFADALSIAKEPYNREREAMLQAGAQVMEQAVESERGSAATAGRVLALQQEGQGKVTDRQSQDLFNLEAAQVEEDSRLRDLDVQLDLGEIEGAQRAAAAAEARSAQHQSQAYQGIANTAQAGLAMVPLYAKGAQARGVNKMARQAKRGSIDYNTNIMNAANQSTIAQQGNAFVAGTDAIVGVGNVNDPNYVAPRAAIGETPQSANFVAAKQMYNWGADGKNQVDVTGLMSAGSPNERKDWWNQQDAGFVDWYREYGMQ